MGQDPVEDTFEALFSINRIAKQYAASATDAYESGWKAQAFLHSVRKDTLYRYKTHILEQLYRDGHIDWVERHTIDDRDYYCLYVDRWSYHSPIDQWSVDGIEEAVEETRTLSDFDTSRTTADEEVLSEQDVLTYLSEQFGSANTFLVQPFVEQEHRSEFTGWSFLPSVIEEGTEVDEDEFVDEYRSEFLFAVGDRFETVAKGEVEIVNRYGVWLEERLHGGRMAPREVYDVEVNGEVHEAVRQDVIHDDWTIRVHDPSNPCERVDGRLGEFVGTGYDGDPGFCEGDVIVLDPEWDDDGPFTYRIGKMTVSWSLVMCELLPVDGDTRKDCLAIEEFVDDIVAVRLHA